MFADAGLSGGQRLPPCEHASAIADTLPDLSPLPPGRRLAVDRIGDGECAPAEVLSLAGDPRAVEQRKAAAPAGDRREGRQVCRRGRRAAPWREREAIAVAAHVRGMGRDWVFRHRQMPCGPCDIGIVFGQRVQIGQVAKSPLIRVLKRSQFRISGAAAPAWRRICDLFWVYGGY